MALNRTMATDSSADRTDHPTTVRAQRPRRIPRRIAQTVINSLKGGVVPRIGLPYITVGRTAEIKALLHDVGIVSDGGASFRFIVGRYGSGKSFLLQTLRNYVMDRGFVVVDADLSPERRLHGTNGQGLATYHELIANMATKTKPEGGALVLVLDRWISSIQQQTAQETGLDPSDPKFLTAVDAKIDAIIGSLDQLVHGFDFARLLEKYYRASLEDDHATKSAVLKWFRGEYERKTEAKNELGVSVIISDDDWYDYIKLFALFFRQAGYQGLYVMIDELVNLSKIPNAISRQYNYEKILTMYNDVMQGKAHHLGILMCGTPQAIEDKRRGVFSYEALRSRLAQGRFSDENHHDMAAPIIHLQPLTAEEMTVLVGKLADMHASLFNHTRTITDEDLAQFIQIEYGRIGADRTITPREVIRDFIELLDILQQHPETHVKQLLTSNDFNYAQSTAVSNKTSEQFAEFTV